MVHLSSTHALPLCFQSGVRQHHALERCVHQSHNTELQKCQRDVFQNCTKWKDKIRDSKTAWIKTYCYSRVVCVKAIQLWQHQKILSSDAKSTACNFQRTPSDSFQDIIILCLNINLCPSWFSTKMSLTRWKWNLLLESPLMGGLLAPYGNTHGSKTSCNSMKIVHLDIYIFYSVADECETNFLVSKSPHTLCCTVKLKHQEQEQKHVLECMVE